MMNILALLAGTLCVLSNGKLTNCTPTTEALIKLQPAAESRRVVWTSDDGKRPARGTGVAEAATLDLGKLRDVAVRVSGDPSRGWPADVHIGFGRDFVYTLPTKRVAKLTTISLPPSRHTLIFQRGHHAVATRSFDLASQPRVDAGEVRLRPLPLLTGTVVTTKEGKDVPLWGAAVSFSGAKPWLANPHLATTDEKGAIRAELPQASAEAIVVSHAGLGSKTNRLERRDADVNLGTIHLLPGVKLTVRVVRPPALRAKPLTVTLYRRDPAVYDPTNIGSQELAGTDDEVRFDEATAGDDIIVVQGAEPLERLSVPVKVEEGKTASAEVRIEPYTLAGRATFGGDPLDNAGLEVYPLDQAWRVTRAAGADGTFGGTAWQHGVLTAFVNDPRIGNGYFANSPELGADPSVWNLDIKKRLITGRIYDAETKEPLPDVYLFVSMALLNDQKRTIHGGSNVHADASGNFTVNALRPGRYELRFALPDYLPKNVVIDIADDYGSKQADFAVERGTAQPLVLRWPDGTPIASATLYDGDAPEPGQLPPRYRSDATGTAMVRGRKGEVHTLYVMPVEGAIAVVQLPIDNDAKPVEVVVGRPTGALRIVARDDEGKPSQGAVILRLNGDLIPLDIVGRRYEMAPGFDAAGERVLERLPPGAYEVWVVRGYGPLPAQPGARVGISAGEERVQVTVPKP